MVRVYGLTGDSLIRLEVIKDEFYKKFEEVPLKIPKREIY